MNADRKPLAKAAPVTGAEQMASKTVRAPDVLWARVHRAAFSRKVDFSESVRRAVSIGVTVMEHPQLMEAYIEVLGVLREHDTAEDVRHASYREAKAHG